MFDQSQQIFPFRIGKSLIVFHFFCFDIYSGRASGFRVLVSSSTPGNNISNGRSTHRKLGFMEFAFLLPPPHHGWLRGRYMDTITIGRDSIQAACFFSLFYFLSFRFLKIRETRSNAHQLGRDRDRTTPIWILDSPIFFISFLFVTRHREAFSEDTQHTKGSHGSANTFASLLIPSLCSRFTNDYNDDLYESMTDDYDSFRYNTT